MERERLHGLLDEATSAGPRAADLVTLTATIAAARRLQAVLESRMMNAATEMERRHH